MKVTNEKILDILSKTVGNYNSSDFDWDLSLREQGLDSFDYMTFIFELSDEFNIEIKESNKLNSLTEIKDFIDKTQA